MIFLRKYYKEIGYTNLPYIFYGKSIKKKLGYKKIIAIFNLLDKESDAIKFSIWDKGSKKWA